MQVPASLERSSGRTKAVIAGFATTLALIGTVLLLAMPGSAHEPTATRPPPPDQVSAPNDRASTAVGWLHGLDDGLISRIDISERLMQQKPIVARTVSDVWSQLRPYRGSPRLASALTWVRGLADGLISVTDISDRLMGQEARMSRTVLVAWHRLMQDDREFGHPDEGRSTWNAPSAVG